MFWKKKTEEKSIIDAQIEHVTDLLDSEMDPFSDNYIVLMDRIEKLNELKKATAKPERKKLSPDTILMASVNIIGIIAVLGYEHGHAITSKAFSMVIKPKL